MLAERFAAALQALGPFPPHPHLAVALSGGADSLALTLLAHRWATARGGRITALTVDHRLRAESTAEAVHVGAMMRAQGIAHHILTPAHTDEERNLQAAARAWRYDALAAYCRAHGILDCLVAHHAGDVRETMLHNIARGHTADGASGMRAATNRSGVRFLRPLLFSERAALEDFLCTNQMVWIDDPSNQNPRFARVRARHMLRSDSAQRDALDAMHTENAAARTARDHALAQAAIHCVAIHPLGFADMSLRAWRTLEPTLASQLLADCITTISGHIHRPRAHETARLVNALDAPFRKRTLQHCEITCDGDRLRIAREYARVAPPLTLRGDGEVLWDGRFKVRHQLADGDHYTLGALGARGRKQLRAQGFDLPPATPCLWHLDEWVMVPHIELPHQATHSIHIGFAPPKPLAAAPFWCFN